MNDISTRQKSGLALAGLLSLSSVPSVLTPTPDGEVGAPMAILVLSTLLGIVGVVGVVLAWRGSRPALRVVAGALVLQIVASLPALFVDVSAGVKAMVGVAVLLAIASLVLMFATARRPVAALD